MVLSAYMVQSVCSLYVVKPECGPPGILTTQYNTTNLYTESAIFMRIQHYTTLYTSLSIRGRPYTTANSVYGLLCIWKFWYVAVYDTYMVYAVCALRSIDMYMV